METYTPKPETAREAIRMTARMMANPAVDTQVIARKVVQHVIENDFKGWICNDPSDPTFKSIVEWAMMMIGEVCEHIQACGMFTIR